MGRKSSIFNRNLSGILAFQGGFGSIIEKAIGQLHKPQAVGDVKPPLLYFEPFGS